MRFHVTGMHCASCVKEIENVARTIPGIVQCTVSFATQTIDVTAENEHSVKELRKHLEEMGYSLVKKREEPSLFWNGIKAFTACVIALPLLVPMIMVIFDMGIHVPAWMQWFIASVLQFVFGLGFYKGAWRALKRWSANMDTLVAMGTSAAYFYSIYLWVATKGTELYFETSGILIALILLGRFFEAYSRKRAHTSLHALVKMLPKEASKKEGNGVVEVPIDSLEKGDIVIVKPGDQVPVDGAILAGSSSVDESMLTGESAPVFKNKNDSVFAGTINNDGRIEVIVTHDPKATYLKKLIGIVQKASESKPPVQNLVDLVAAIFVPSVVVISIFTFVIWSVFLGQVQDGIINAVAILVVACPCALGLATPIVILVATTRAANAGILVKDISALQRGASLKTIVFDKTGTVTSGKLHVVSVEGDVSAVGKSLGSQSRHPLSRACADSLPDVEPRPVDGFKEHPGRGVEGVVGKKLSLMGSYRFMKERKIENLPEHSSSAVYVAQDGKYIGAFFLEDSLLPGIEDLFEWLSKKNIETVVVSGDKRSVVEHLVSIVKPTSWYAEKLPEEKGKLIKELQKKGPVGMIGDGVNDAPALALSNVGIAIGTGTDVAMESADVGLLKDIPKTLPLFLVLGRRTMVKIWQNLFFAFVYNCIGIVCAAFGYLNPMIAGLAMGLSSLSVVMNALFLKVKP